MAARQMAADQKKFKKNAKFLSALFRHFFSTFPDSSKTDLARFWWNPHFRYWFSSTASIFHVSRLFRIFFLSFSETCEIGTFSTQTQLFLKVSKTRIRLIFLKSPTGACQIPLKSILAASPWKISIRDDSGVKFWLNYFWRIEKSWKK